MTSICQDLATRLSAAAAAAGPTSRLLVAIAGAPGCGKTTIATAVVKRLNSKSGAQNAIAISMDGFHLPRSVLDKLPNRQEAYARRGAPWTFDVKGIVTLVQSLRNSANVTLPLRKPIYAPTFDHAAKDPTENGVLISENVSVVILEGNYLLLDEDDWRDVSQLVDLRVFIEVDPTEARERVARRHVDAGIELNLENARRRFDQNDNVNGMLIRKRLIPPDIFVQSTTEQDE